MSNDKIDKIKACEERFLKSKTIKSLPIDYEPFNPFVNNVQNDNTNSIPKQEFPVFALLASIPILAFGALIVYGIVGIIIESFVRLN